MMGCAIAIDLGSNTLRLTAIACENGKVLYEYEKIVRTAQNLTRNGNVGDEALHRIIEGICEIKQEIDLGRCMLRAVTTEALRRAKNRDEVIERIERAVGVKFEVISPKEEAELTLLAVQNRLKRLCFVSDSFVMIDIGGGSTEVVIRYAHEYISKSFPVGIVSVAETYRSVKAIEEALGQLMLPIRKFVSEIYATKGEVSAFVATAGTPTTLAAMKLGMNYGNYNARKVNGTMLRKDELRVFLKSLLQMDYTKREQAVGVGRGDLIIAGILIFEYCFSIVGFDTAVVVDDGLREGVALSLCRMSGSKE